MLCILFSSALARLWAGHLNLFARYGNPWSTDVSTQITAIRLAR